MRAVDLIQKKRENQALTAAEIQFLLQGYLEGSIPDYQISAFLMAVYFNGMTESELIEFTTVMSQSGDQIRFPASGAFLIDKHSTGGVGDKTTIALLPLWGALGIASAKLSGRGLGHTGGTIDKFEAIPGFQFATTREELITLIHKVGIGVMGYSDSIVPLDQKLYALRDVTATVPSIPLLASSIMSKKLAVHTDAIVLDVKVGDGAFMKDRSQARELAMQMLNLGQRSQRKITCVLSNMEQPLGTAIGNSLELIEAIEFLKGRGAADFSELVHTLAAIALKLKGEISEIEEGVTIVRSAIQSGQPLEILKNFISECGGDSTVVDDYDRLPNAPHRSILVAQQAGYLSQIAAESIGTAAMILGAGRSRKEDSIDPAVGITLKKKVGDRVRTGEALAELRYSNENSLESAVQLVTGAIAISDTPPDPLPVILDILE